MSLLGDLLRRARLRGLKEGTVQTARAESLDNQAADNAERWQDYGFAANPVDGQGLVLNVAGHTIVLRMDRLAERPPLQALEVAVWHKEGHHIVLKAGGVIELNGTQLNVNMSAGVAFNAPSVTHGGVSIGGTHTHGGVQAGGSRTSAPG